jgi:hypothetical protein
MQKAASRYRWYERERWPYAADRKIAEEYAQWLKDVPWRGKRLRFVCLAAVACSVVCFLLARYTNLFG